MNRAARTYDVGDRVTIVGGPKLRADTGVVVEVKQDPLPYRVDFGAPWTPAWWSGIDLEPASEIFAVDPVREYERRAEVDDDTTIAPVRVTPRKVDGDFASVAEHIAAWQAGGRRWAKVEGFNVDAWQAERDADHAEQARFDAVAAMLAGEPVQAARCGVPAEIGEATPCPMCGAARGKR